MASKILLVDDDSDLRNILKTLLEQERFEVTQAPNGIIALEIVDASYDLIILDIMMPEIDGIEVCKKIRENFQMPILFLTAKATDFDKHIGFLNGCDDYLSKPFSSVELVSRVSALIRRYTIYMGKPQNDSKLHIKDLCIDLSTHLINRGNEEIRLTSHEYEILILLAQNSGKVFSLQNIYESVWHEPYYYTSNSTIMVHIKNLRKKLADEQNSTTYIENVWGRGYRVICDTI